MLGTYTAQNDLDLNGNPAGGSVEGVGLSIRWQDGPLGRGEERKPPNGAFVETVIAAAKQRLEFYQQSKFACPQNEMAIGLLASALFALKERTQLRELRGVEGTHAV